MSDEQQHQQRHHQQQQHHHLQQQQLQQHSSSQQQHKCLKDNMNRNEASTSPTATQTGSAASQADSAASTSISLTTAATTPTTSTTQQQQQQRAKTNIHELRNQDYVSRLMAATPPYLYSAPVGPNNFFFSDMLRSLVQARNNENARTLQLQQSVLAARRPRKRSWSQHRPYYDHLRDRKEVDYRQQQQHQQQQQLLVNTAAAAAEKPLELTNKPYPLFHQMVSKYRGSNGVNGTKIPDDKEGLNIKLPTSLTIPKTIDLEESATPCSTNEATNFSGGGAVDSLLQDTPPAASLPPQDLVLPPPPPVWYPPLYPPYGIDPLHFFIDLRVSGHIYDRKKENVSPLTSNNATTENGSSASANGGETPDAAALPIASNHPTNLLPSKNRHGSAFTVPVPRSNAPTTDAINLSNVASKQFENYAKYYDLGEAKENHPFAKGTNANANAGANYMLQHLPRLYSQFAARDLIASNVVAAAAAVSEQQQLQQQQQNAAILRHHHHQQQQHKHHPTIDLDNKSEPDCDADSLEDDRTSADNYAILDHQQHHQHNRERDDIDVEIIDPSSMKYRNDSGGCGDSSRCTSPDEASITQID